MATKTKRLSELTIDEIRFLLRKRGLSADGSEDPLRQRLRKVLMEESTANSSEGLQDTKTAPADNGRNAGGMLKQKEEFDMEVLVDDFEMCGGSRDSLKEGVSKTPETGDKGGEERKESESEEKGKNLDAPKPTSALWISGLTSAAKASALKVVFSKYGQVNAAKVMASSKSEGKWFGLVVMSNPEEALLCIQNVNNTQFQDDVITVEFDPKQRGATLPLQQASKETDSRQSDEEPLMSLWVSGLPVTTKAADLKEIFGKFGEVVHAKVAASKNDESKGYFGIVTMKTIEEADACVENLNQTEIKGNVITVEKNKRHSSKPRATSSSRQERPERRDWSPPPYERDRFYDNRGGFRGRRFPPRPYMGRGRGFRGRGRESFAYMDDIRADYDRHMEHSRRGDDEYDREFFRERDHYRGRPRPFDRSWDHPRGGFSPRGMSGHEPYWGQAAKRPRFDDDMPPPRDRQQMEPDDRFHSERRGMMDERRGMMNDRRGMRDDRRGMMDNRRGMMDDRRGMMDDKRGMMDDGRGVMDDRRGMMDDRGSWGGSGGYSDSRNPVSDKPMIGEVANERRDFGTRPDNRMPSRNSENLGGSTRGRNQWHSSGNTTATNESTGYQTGLPAVSNYNLNQSNYSGLDSSAKGSYGESANNSFAGSSKPNTFEMPVRNQHSNTGGSYGATNSSSFGQSIHGEAGGSSFGATGGSSFGATGGNSFGATGGSSFGATGGSSFGATGGSSFGATGGSSFGATGGSSFGAKDSSSFGAKDSSSFRATGGNSFGGTGGSSFRGGGGGNFGGASGGSFGRAGGNAFGEASGSSLGRTGDGAFGRTVGGEGGGSSFERMGTVLSRDSSGMNNRASASGSYVEGSSFQGTAGNLSGGTGGGGYGGMGGGSSLGGGTGGSSLRVSSGNSFGGGISLGQGISNTFSSAGGSGSSFGGASGNVLGGTRDNSYRVPGSTSYGLTGDNSYVGKESSSYGGTLHSLYSEAGNNTYGGVEARSHIASGSGSYGGSMTGTSIGIPGKSSFTAGGSVSYGGKLGNSYEGGGSYGSSNMPSVGVSSSSSSFGASSSYFSQGGNPYSTHATTMFDGSNQYAGSTGTSFTASGGGTMGAMNAPQSQYPAYNPQGGSGQSYPWY